MILLGVLAALPRRDLCTDLGRAWIARRKRVGSLVWPNRIDQRTECRETGRAHDRRVTAQASEHQRAAWPVGRRPRSCAALDELRGAGPRVGRGLVVCARPGPTLARWLEGRLAWVVAAWLLGVCLFSLRLLVGWVAIERLKRVGVRPVGGDLAPRFDDLAAKARGSAGRSGCWSRPWPRSRRSSAA